MINGSIKSNIWQREILQCDTTISFGKERRWLKQTVEGRSPQPFKLAVEVPSFSCWDEVIAFQI